MIIPKPYATSICSQQLMSVHSLRIPQRIRKMIRSADGAWGNREEMRQIVSRLMLEDFIIPDNSFLNACGLNTTIIHIQKVR